MFLKQGFVYGNCQPHIHIDEGLNSTFELNFEDVTFELWNPQSGCTSNISPEIELVGGSGPNEGNLMLHGQPICDDGWGHNEAMVVCRFEQ